MIKKLISIIPVLSLAINIIQLKAQQDVFWVENIDYDVYYHTPHDVPLNERYTNENGVEHLLVYQDDAPFQEGSGTKPRSEVRILNNYTTGIHQMTFDMMIPTGTTGCSVFQIFGGGDGGATSLMLHTYDGYVNEYVSDHLTENVYDEWHSYKVQHFTESGNINIYVDDTLKMTVKDRGDDTHYFKYGVYEQWNSSYKMEAYFKNVHVYEGFDGDSCNSTSITPYLQTNGGAWQSTTSASLNVGDDIKFGPQPVSGGSWSWTGPNGYSASTREILLTNLSNSQAGIYVATFTNLCDESSSIDFEIEITSENDITNILHSDISGTKSSTKRLIAYPNPVNDVLYLKNLPEQTNIQLFDMTGKLVIEVQNKNRIDLSNLHNGHYFLKIVTLGNNKCVMITKQ